MKLQKLLKNLICEIVIYLIFGLYRSLVQSIHNRDCLWFQSKNAQFFQKDYPLVGTHCNKAFGHINVTNGVNERKHVKMLWKFSKYIRICPIVVVEKHATNSNACILRQGPLKMWIEHLLSLSLPFDWILWSCYRIINVIYCPKNLCHLK